MNDGVAGLGLLYWVTRLSKGAFTEGSRLMLLLGPIKSRISQKSH